MSSPLHKHSGSGILRNVIISETEDISRQISVVSVPTLIIIHILTAEEFESGEDVGRNEHQVLIS